MLTNHFRHWPNRVPFKLTVPETTLYDNLAVSARRYPNKAAIHYYGATLTYRQLKEQVDHLAGYLRHVCQVRREDRVVLYMQNSPQYVIAFHAILRAGGVVVPVNPMNLTDELAFYFEDSRASIAVVGQELYPRIAPLHNARDLAHVICAAYSDVLPASSAYELPEEVKADAQREFTASVALWRQVLEQKLDPGPEIGAADDLAVLPYTSGTTGRPKGCMHTHRTVQANVLGAAHWFGATADGVILTTLPLFHVTGMVHSMLLSVYTGATMVIMTRWNREVAAQLIERLGCTHWTNIATMVIDFLGNQNLDQINLSSLAVIGGGGATLPEAVGEQLLKRTGLRYVEGYGLSETISQTHFNPPDRPKMQCMGVPSFAVDARVIDPETMRECGPHEEGEVIVCGPQVFLGYWQRPDENQKAFIEWDGKRFFCTGDIARYDDEGYFFMVDRVKRMINASGFKVWPTEVEALLYGHSAIEQACVIGIPDERRGETVKAFVVLKRDSSSSVTAESIMEWAKDHMAVYKCPRVIEFVERLPVSGSGKVLWRVLQEQEQAKR